MDLVTFISHDSPAKLGSTFCFITKQNSSLITKIFKKKFESVSNQISIIDSLDSQAALKAQLMMGFLGEISVFWLSENLLSENSTVSSLLHAYSGPNIIGYVSKIVPAQEGTQEIIIEVPEEVTYEEFTRLFSFLYPAQSAKCTQIVKQLFRISTVLNIDSVFVLMHYCILVGNKSDAFLHEWLPTLLNPEKSLFTLSSLLFAKKEQQFFQLWTMICDDYSDPFWTTFWSEQLFKATLFCLLMHDKNFTKAKRVAYRLPFSFMQKDWKLVTVDKLKQAHDHLYSIDWNIKNGLPAHFEHFYLQFMLH